MMKNIIIVGGGFAGVWAALGAAHQVIDNKANIRITLVSKDPQYLAIFGVRAQFFLIFEL
jgi:NADH dehydrogenase FAD-containing subunit